MNLNQIRMPCPIGFWCSGGIADKKACEATEALPGNYCPGAGYEPAGVECPVGYYCEVILFFFSPLPPSLPLPK